MIPKIRLRTTYTAVTSLYRPASVGIETLTRTVVKRIRTLAAYFIKAISVLCARIAEAFYKLTRIKMSAALAQIVDAQPVSPFRSVVNIKAWKRAEKDEI